MYDEDASGEKHPFTAHTTNRVPFIVVDPAAKLTGIEDGAPVGPSHRRCSPSPVSSPPPR